MPTLKLPKSSVSKRFEIFSEPSLFNPYQTTIDLDLIILNRRLPGLPGHISPVKDPNSAKPKPKEG